MDDIRQETPNEGRSLNKKFGTHVKESMVFHALEKKLVYHS